MEIVKRNRIEWIDFMKGIAILWLIVYHFYVIDWLRSPVPVFFFLSGLFFSEGKSFGSFVRKKAKALLIPLLFFFVLGVVASASKCMLQGETYSFPALWRFATFIPTAAKDANPLGVGAIWFLLSLFEIYVIYYMLRLLSKNCWWLLGAGLLLFIVSCVTMQYYAQGSLFYLLYTFGYCVFFIAANLLKEKVLFGQIPTWVLFIAVVVYFVRFLEIPDCLGGGGILSGVRWLVSEAGLIVALIWLCKSLSSINLVYGSNFFRFMLFEGRNSLTILGTHLLAMSIALILLSKVLQQGLLYWIILFVLELILSNICVVLFNRFVPGLVNHKE